MAFYSRTMFAEPQPPSILVSLTDFKLGTHSGRAIITKKKVSCPPSFQPKFDVRETRDAYELHGELPGVAREDIRLAFDDRQSLVIHGKVERSYNSNSTAGPEEAATDAAAADSETVEPAARESFADDRASHQASVADEDEAEAQEENGWQEVAATNNEPEQQQQEVAPVVAPQEKPTDNAAATYLVNERSIGKFSRRFNFPSRVEQEAATAKFNNGILTIVVPKAKKHEVRHISIN